MASAKPGVHIVQLKPVVVPNFMVKDGAKFIKWEEESLDTVTLKVDPYGYYLYWVSQNGEVDCLDIAGIRDTRTGRGAKVPKDPKLRQQLHFGSNDSIEDKTMTVVTGPDFVNLTFYNFVTESKGVAESWTNSLLSIATNTLQLNSPVISFLRKIHTKLILTKPIPVKNIIKTFTSNKDDKKRVERALSDTLKQNFEKTSTLADLSFEDFFQFYKNLTVRSEINQVFAKFSNSEYMTAEDFMEFINKEQRDPRLNEILYPYLTEERAKELIEKYENKPGGLLSFEGLLKYLISEDNALVSYEKYDLSDDMDQPLSHYFINSSHNTYLTGHQLTGKSSVEMYRQALLAGCRCVELDFWNGSGRSEEPVIVHGYTLVPDIPAKDVIEAIAESAFKSSEYPVILSFENHCNPKQQAKIAGYCREFFGEMLLDGEVDGWPLTPSTHLPPPSFLKRKIIIKNKKKHSNPQQAESSDSEDDSSSSSSSSSKDKGTAAKESEAGAEISALVNYVQPVHFYSFEQSALRARAYEMSSFDEKQAMTLLKERPVEFVNYNKFQLSRVYPRGTRVDSGNFMPQLFWNAGCQLVALNYQTMDLAMQLNMGIFELNKKCGYLLKPEFMRRKDRGFDPFAESTVDGIIAGRVGIKILSAQFLTRTRTSTSIEVEMYGLPTDTIRKKFKTKLINNSLNPQFEDETFIFKKVVLPELAFIRFAAYEESGKLIGHRVLPIIGLRPGYRHVVLRNESGQPLNLSTIFVHISVSDYVPDGLSDFAEALANPIKYQNELEKRAKQLTVLIDGGEDEDTPSSSSEAPSFPAPQQQPQHSSPVQTKQWNVSIKKKPEISKAESDSERTVLIGPPPIEFLVCYGDEPGKVKFIVESFESYLSSKGYKDKHGGVVKKMGEAKKKRSLLGLGGSRGDLQQQTLTDPPQYPTSKHIDDLSKHLEKSIKESHTKQLKYLSTLKEKQTAEIMNWLSRWRKDEHKRLSKLTKDKNELDRMKREVNNVLVAKGVTERARMEKCYEEVERRVRMDMDGVWKEWEEWKRGVSYNF